MPRLMIFDGTSERESTGRELRASPLPGKDWRFANLDSRLTLRVLLGRD